jgi:hypothetical protein
MKAQMLQIADDLRNGKIDTKTAQNLLLGLFVVSGMLPDNKHILEVAQLRTDNFEEQKQFLQGAIYIRDVALGNYR